MSTAPMIRLSPEAVRLADLASERVGYSISATVDILIRLHAAELTAERIPPAAVPRGARGRRGRGRKKSGKSLGKSANCP